MNKLLGRREELASVVTAAFRWGAWEALLVAEGYTLDRPYGTAHPRFPEIVYPLDYGYVNGTQSSDGEPVDVFVGTGTAGLVGCALTQDYRRGDREVKLLYRCTPAEIYLVHGFLNFAPALMQSDLVLRKPMHVLWAAAQSSPRHACPADAPLRP